MPENAKTTNGKAKNIASLVREAVTAPIEQAGYAVWDVTFYKEVAEMILEIAIDRKEPADGSPAEPIGTDDCMAVTKIVDPILDELDPIEESYSLMVSGGGSFRDLRLPEHLAYAKEKHLPVTVRTFTALETEPAPGSEPETGKDGKSKSNTKNKKKKAADPKQLEGFISFFDEHTLTLETETGTADIDRKQIAKLTAQVDGTLPDGSADE